MTWRGERQNGNEGRVEQTDSESIPAKTSAHTVTPRLDLGVHAAEPSTGPPVPVKFREKTQVWIAGSSPAMTWRGGRQNGNEGRVEQTDSESIPAKTSAHTVTPRPDLGVHAAEPSTGPPAQVKFRETTQAWIAGSSPAMTWRGGRQNGNEGRVEQTEPAANPTT